MDNLIKLASRSGALYVTYSALVQCGVSSRTIESWKDLKESHPDDARVKVFALNNLRTKYQLLIQEELCDGQDPVQWFDTAQKQRAEKMNQVAAASIADAVVVKPEDVVFYFKTKLFTDPECKELAKAWAWLRLLNSIKGKKDAADYGFKTKGALLEEACVIIGQQQLKGLKARGTDALNKRVLQRKMKDAAEQGRQCLISGHHGKVKHCKITTEISNWLVAQYGQPVKGRTTQWLHYHYSVKAQVEGWPDLSHSAIRMHLYKPEIAPIWYVGRHGTHAASAKFGHTLSLKGASMREAMWVSDGTKLDWYYRTDDGRKAQLQFYLVVDAYSEMILGWDISRTEDFVTQYKAAKMAIQTAGHKPNQWIYDGQGGHVKKEAQAFYDSIVTDVHHRVRAYRAHAKPIEQMINRFQQACIMQYWFCDGQGVKTRKEDSRPNMQYILKHTHDLPTEEQAIAAFAQEVKNWNNMKHPQSTESRWDVYQASSNAHSPEISYLEMVDIFWHTSAKPIQYTKDGLKMISQKDVHWFEVYDEQGNIDLDFRRQYIGTIPFKFYVKYDPEDLDEVWLYLPQQDGSMKFIAKASSKRRHARAVVDQQPGDREKTMADLKTGDDEKAGWLADLAEIRRLAGVNQDDVIRDANQLLKEGMYAGKDDAKWAESVYVDTAKKSNNRTSVDPWDQI